MKFSSSKDSIKRKVSVSSLEPAAAHVRRPRLKGLRVLLTPREHFVVGHGCKFNRLFLLEAGTKGAGHGRPSRHLLLATRETEPFALVPCPPYVPMLTPL